MSDPTLKAQPRTRREAVRALYAREVQLRRLRRVDAQGHRYVPAEVRMELKEIETRRQTIESLGK